MMLYACIPNLAGSYMVRILLHGRVLVRYYGLRFNCYLDSVEILIPLIGNVSRSRILK